MPRKYSVQMLRIEELNCQIEMKEWQKRTVERDTGSKRVLDQSDERDAGWRGAHQCFGNGHNPDTISRLYACSITLKVRRTYSFLF